MPRLGSAFPAAAILITLAGPASAATFVGILRAADPAHHRILFDNGVAFQLEPSINMRTLPVGKDTFVIYEVVGGQRVASSVEPVLPRIGPEVNESDKPSPLFRSR